jgi:hypothetical protein
MKCAEQRVGALVVKAMYMQCDQLQFRQFIKPSPIQRRMQCSFSEHCLLKDGEYISSANCKCVTPEESKNS